jgi:hypothetical protein
MARLRFARAEAEAEAEAEAVKLASIFVAAHPEAFCLQCVGAIPDNMAERRRHSKHPVARVVIFKAPPPPDVVMDGGEPFVTLNIASKEVAIRK